MFVLCCLQTIDLRVVRFADAFRCTVGIVWPPEVCHSHAAAVSCICKQVGVDDSARRTRTVLCKQTMGRTQRGRVARGMQTRSVHAYAGDASGKKLLVILGSYV